jgi:hypothetical protein
VHARLEPRLYQRVLAAAEAEGLSLSALLREAVEEHLGTVEREAAERAVLLAEARKFLAVPAGSTAAYRDAYRLVERYVEALEATAGRLCEAERRGRARALQEVAAGALEPLTAKSHLPGVPPGRAPCGPGDDRAAPPRVPAGGAGRRAGPGAASGAAAAVPAALGAGLLGEQRTRELFRQAAGWPGARWVFCAHHGMAPSAPSSDGERCYLGCQVGRGGNAPEAA